MVQCVTMREYKSVFVSTRPSAATAAVIFRIGRGPKRGSIQASRWPLCSPVVSDNAPLPIPPIHVRCYLSTNREVEVGVHVERDIARRTKTANSRCAFDKDYKVLFLGAGPAPTTLQSSCPELAVA